MAESFLVNLPDNNNSPYLSILDKYSFFMNINLSTMLL